MPEKPTENALKQKIRLLEKENARLNKIRRELSISNSRFQSFLDSIDDSILICDRKAQPVIWNRVYAKDMKEIRGIEMTPGMELDGRLTVGKDVVLRKNLLKTILSGEQFRTFCTLDSDKNNVRYLEITYSPIYENHHITGFSVLTRDITKQKLAEEELINFKQAVDASADAIGMSTALGNHYYQNASFDDLFGNIGNDPPSTLYTDEAIGREIFETIMHGTPWIGEVDMHGKNSEILNILLRAYPVTDIEGKVRRLVGVHTNITEQKETEKELRKHREHLQDLVNERTRELQKSEEALRSSRERSRDLSRYLQRAVEDERIRIAREIHDDLGQTLIAMKMSLVSCRNKLPDHLDPLFETALNMEESINRMIQSIKIMISDLRAGPLSDLGLEAAIEWLAKSFFKDMGYDDFKIDLNTESVDIDPSRSMALFRIAQETLTNIVRHSDATAVTINLFVKNNQAILRISDNGSGMPDVSALPNSSYGIMGMKERARFFKGNLFIESNEKDGTTITASIPIDD
jgi:signal transduction histidine kinase